MLAVLKLEQEFNAYDEQISCTGVPLPTASTNSNSRGGVAIDKDGRLEVFEEGVYPGDVRGV